jgi:hypothetical protein
LRFDAAERYGKLLGLYRKVGFADEVRWLESRLARIRGAGGE